MSELDYQKLKFKAGLEIHQQLDTHKLFCSCPSVLRKDEPEFEIKRKLHAVAGESGEIDVAAQHEASKDKEFIYQGYDTTCLVELDEEPPHQINQEALDIALQIALLLNCKIFPITQIMRKTVIDGSNTSGFQRTVLIAYDGYVETSSGKIGIESVALEEDAARIISKESSRTIYRLDRLGIPLVEITTSPDIKTPEQAKEVALHIGDILRSCKVKRGLGTIRQDVNLSILDGSRVEIKGVQDMKIFVKTIEKEVKRQLEIIEKGGKVEKEVRNALPDATTEFLRPMPGAARMYPETDLPLLRISRERINKLKKSLPKLRSEIEKELKKKGLNSEMIQIMFKENKTNLFLNLIKVYDSPVLIGKMILLYPKEIAKHLKKSLDDVEKTLDEEKYSFVLESLRNKKIEESQIKEVLERIVKGASLEEAIKFEKVDLSEIEEEIFKIIKSKPGLSPNAYMGLVMKQFRGKIDGKSAMEIIQKFLKGGKK